MAGGEETRMNRNCITLLLTVALGAGLIGEVRAQSEGRVAFRVGVKQGVSAMQDLSQEAAGYADLASCLTGPAAGYSSAICEAFDANGDGSIDIVDFAAFQQHFGVGGTCFDLEQAEGYGNALLSVNRNDSSIYPQTLVAGELDLTLLVVQGQPGADYSVESCSFQDAFGGEVVASGTLDAAGMASVIIPPDNFLRGQVLSLQARVTDDLSPTGVAMSAASRVKVIPTMSANIALNMAVGSLADVLGPVMDITPNSINIGNLTFVVTPATVFANVTDLSGLVLGDWVAVKGGFNATGGFDAEEIGLEDPQNQVRLDGRVQSVGPAGFAILGFSFYVSTETVFIDDATGDPRTFADLLPGMPVEVRVVVETQFPSATLIKLNTPIELEPEPEPEPEDENEIELPPPPPFCS